MFMEKYVLAKKLSTNRLNMSLPQQAKVENIVHEG